MKPIIFALGLAIAPPLACHAEQSCDFEHHCFDTGPPHQTYHLDPNNPDRETPPPAPQYPAPSAQGRDIVVQPNAGEGCHLFRMRSTPAIAPQIVEICPISPDEEAEIRQRVEGLGGAQ